MGQQKPPNKLKPKEAVATPDYFGQIYLSLIAVLIGCNTAFVYALRGPEFLIFYFLLYLVLFFTDFFYRDRYEYQASVLSFLIFEAEGIYRYVTASAEGMHNFRVMGQFMLFGGLLFFLRSKSGGNGYGFFGCSSCSSGSGCSGGCGGSCGGGCGGCGG